MSSCVLWAACWTPSCPQTGGRQVEVYSAGHVRGSATHLAYCSSWGRGLKGRGYVSQLQLPLRSVPIFITGIAWTFPVSYGLNMACQSLCFTITDARAVFFENSLGFQGSLRVACAIAWVWTRRQPDYGMYTGVLQKSESGGSLAWC